MAEDHWHPARLIPTSGINGQEEAEKRATSALLAVMQAVREFGIAVIKPFGAPAGPVSTFIEVPFQMDDRTVYPDGWLRQPGRVEPGPRSSGQDRLGRSRAATDRDLPRHRQRERLRRGAHDLQPDGPGARCAPGRRGQAPAQEGGAPPPVLGRGAHRRGPATGNRGVDDPDQAWILGELIRYLEHPRSGALDFRIWVGVGSGPRGRWCLNPACSRQGPA